MINLPGTLVDEAVGLGPSQRPNRPLVHSTIRQLTQAVGKLRNYLSVVMKLLDELVEIWLLGASLACSIF